MKLGKIAGLLGLVMVVVSCTPEEISKTPQLSFVEMGWLPKPDPNVPDTMYVALRIKDKDPDPNSPMQLYYQIFAANDTFIFSYAEILAMPDISIIDTTKGVDAKTKLKVARSNFALNDTIKYRIWVTDPTGMTSDTLKTPNFITN